MKKTLKDRFYKLCNDLKPMSFPDKLDHIWSYYKTEMYIALLLVVILAAVITGVINTNRKVLISGVVVNSIDLDAYTYISDTYQLERNAGAVDLTNVVYSELEDEKLLGDTYNYVMRVIAMVNSKTLDYMIMDTVGLEGYMRQDFFMDLSLLLPEEELQQWGTQLVYMEYYETGEKIPVAICLNNTNFGKKHLADSEQKFYLSFVATTEKTQECLAFWKYLSKAE